MYTLIIVCLSQHRLFPNYKLLFLLATMRNKLVFMKQNKKKAKQKTFLINKTKKSDRNKKRTKQKKMLTSQQKKKLSCQQLHVVYCLFVCVTFVLVQVHHHTVYILLHLIPHYPLYLVIPHHLLPTLPGRTTSPTSPGNITPTMYDIIYTCLHIVSQVHRVFTLLRIRSLQASASQKSCHTLL